jgi:hypothetical protein
MTSGEKYKDNISLLKRSADQGVLMQSLPMGKGKYDP